MSGINSSMMSIQLATLRHSLNMSIIQNQQLLSSGLTSTSAQAPHPHAGKQIDIRV
ncbi:polyribonucleotide nucleotidyltransferase [Marinicrinis sediminis]|uniref:Polyribonucleotide nucleotidyltransferase n=1 Tax=Marinicrinis sediminis TaxID=1652465 RepID=A0ABW5RBZ4_9BACL